MVTITIDGTSYEVEKGQNLLQACLSLGLNLPYFCWHPALGSVGACRQCALLQYQDESDDRGRLIMGCMTPVADGQILSIDAENATDFRAGIIETLMTNHPHDCPVCEEGGECHLQDMTVMSGHHQRRYRGLKRTFPNQQLGPFINHEMNRCITCYRCLRYYRDYAGGDDLHAMASRNRTWFGRFQDGPLESEFSGNLVEVCPTGVFTDKTLSDHYSRKWDLQCAPSVCVHCSLGCNTSPGERYGVLRRIQNRFNREINGYFLCDRGRFGYGFVNHPERPRQPFIRRGDQWQSLSAAEGAAELGQRLNDSNMRWIGIGSPRATTESNLALQRLVGNDHFFSGLSRQDEQLSQALLKLLRSGHGHCASLQQMEAADAVLLLGEDLTQTAPRMALSVRQAVNSAGRVKAGGIGVPPWQDQAVRIAGQDSRYPFWLTAVADTRLDDLASARYRASPREQARLAFAVAHELWPEAPAVGGLSREQQTLATTIADGLGRAARPLIISGSGPRCPELIEACEQILKALSCRTSNEDQAAMVALIPGECNSTGLALLNHRGRENCLDDAFALAEQCATNWASGAGLGVIILENDLFTRASEASVSAFFEHLTQVVVIDYLPGATMDRADLVLPSTSFAETRGVLISNEARGQLLLPVCPPPEQIRMGWQWLHQALPQPDSPVAEISTPEQALQACLETEPMLAALAQLEADGELRFRGMKMARMPHRASGRTAMNAGISVHEPKQPEDPDSPLAFSMEGVPGTSMACDQPGGGLMPFSWYPGWNSGQSVHKFRDEINGVTSAGDAGPTTGVRLMLHSHPDNREGWNEPPKKPRASSQQLLLIPIPEIFGSDELSVRAAPVAARMAPLTVRLHPADAEEHQITAGDLVQIGIGGQHIQLPVQLNPNQARKLALIAERHPALQGLTPDWVTARSLGPDPIIGSDRRNGNV